MEPQIIPRYSTVYLGKPSQTPSVRKVAFSFTRLSYNTKKRSIPLPKFPCKVHTITANIIYPPWLWFCPKKQNPMRVYYHQGPSHQPFSPSCLSFHHYVNHLDIFFSWTPHPGIHQGRDLQDLGRISSLHMFPLKKFC